MERGVHSVTPECEYLYEDGPDSDLLFKQCTKNPGHPDFIPVTEFCLQHLPADCRTQENLDCIRSWVDRTVKISVNYTNPSRPSWCPASSNPRDSKYFRGKTRRRRCGTGYLLEVSRDLVRLGHPCECCLCRASEAPQYSQYLIKVATASHVIYDESEAFYATVDCFFDSKDRSGVASLHGINDAIIRSGDTDYSFFRCVTHDKGLHERLLHVMDRNEWSSDVPCMIISHPHGCSKHITVGENAPDRISPYDDQDGPSNYTFQWVSYRLPAHLQGGSLLLGGTPIDTGPGFHQMPLTIVACHKDVDLSPLFNNDRFTFPPGTILKDAEGREINMPPETEFSAFLSSKTMCYVTYTTHTCPGSSGAPVVRQADITDNETHSGSLLDGTNRSCWSVQ